MIERIDIFMYRLRFLVVGALIVASLFLLSAILSTSVTAQDTDTSSSSLSGVLYDDSNVITASVAVVATDAVQAVQATGQAISGSSQAAAHATAQGGKTVAAGTARSGRFVLRVARAYTTFMNRSIVRSVSFVFGMPRGAFGFVANTHLVRTALRPADNMAVPVIDPHAPVLLAKAAAAHPEPAITATPPADATASWPISGAITTPFGVPHWPYQPTHTGIDISDGQRSGVTPVRPFKPGRVIETIRSYRGLGNYVVVDHGAGVTSLYGHLASIAVQAGQMVDKSAVLGHEGSTGASTGTHLHFEIRVNGQLVNPLQYISGRP